MTYSVLLFLSAVALFIITRLRKKSWARNGFQQPPGPLGLPILGHLPLLGKNPPETLMKWAQKYGPIFQVQFGSFRCVVLSDAKIIAEGFSMPSLSGRPLTATLTGATKRKGIVLSELKDNQEQRRFFLRALTEFGLKTTNGQPSLFEQAMEEEVLKFIEVLRSKAGDPTPVAHMFNVNILNAVWKCIMSKKLHIGKESERLQKLTYRTCAIPGILAQLGMFMPWLGRILPGPTGVISGCKAFEELYLFLDEQIEEHNRSRVKGKPRDVTDAYLDKVEEVQDPKSTFHASNNYIRATLSDMFVASGETTSSTLEYAILYLAQNTEVQHKLQLEISSRVPSNRLPSLNDRANMPYTCAVVNEIIRLASSVPLGIFHNATEDTVLNGFLIPKDTVVYSNLYAVNYSSKYWTEPEKFNPERFLLSNNIDREKDNPRTIMSFGIGRRMCTGERIARDQIFMYVTSIFQIFSIKMYPELKAVARGFGFASHPEPFEVVFSLRD